ncbi:MAG: glycine oxidase ThiO [Gammaproteobacteria bacterium]
MLSTPDITLIGGGVSGLLTAREFVLAGASVAVFDKNRLGQESSWAGGGILLPLYPWRQDEAISTLTIYSHRIYPQLAEELFADTGIDPEWQQSGLLITKNPDEASALQWCRQFQMPVEPPSAEMLAGFRTTPHHPLWLPEIAHIRNPRLLKALRCDLEKRGVAFFEHCELLNAAIRGSRIESITTSAGNHPVNHLIIAAGAWSGCLWQQMFAADERQTIAIHPVKGQMLLYDGPPGLLPTMILDDNRYLIPRRDGKILAGSSVEQTGFDKTVDAETRQTLHEFALTLFPPLKNIAMTRHWAGLRPGTENGIPYIGIHPVIENLSINAGHFRNGLAMGPACARLLAALVTGKQTPFSPEPYQISARH